MMATTWRVARSLDMLLSQLNAAAPRRSKISDGSIGDAAHATRTSDHNPWIKLGILGIVTARDFTHDPAGGLDCNALAASLTASGDPRIKYIIWRRRIWSTSGWKPYGGTNPHDKHLHLSVSATPSLFDSGNPWPVRTSGADNPTPTPTPTPEDPFMALTDDQQIRLLAAAEKGAWLADQMKPQIDRLPDEDAQTDLLMWAVTDPDEGLRTLVASLQGQVTELTAAVGALSEHLKPV